MFFSIPIFFGLSASFIWLMFYLRKDAHPESNKMVLKIFIFGMLTTIPAALAEIGIFERISKVWIENNPYLFIILYQLFAVALTEEFLKYFVVKKAVLKNKEFDEPVDAMIYMIISALGFAALENILALFGMPFINVLFISSLRFIGATFLHALVSGTIGYFLALSIAKTKKRTSFIAAGISISVILHALFNIFIIGIETARIAGKTPLAVFFGVCVVIILISLSIFVSRGFKKLKKLSSTCKI